MSEEVKLGMIYRPYGNRDYAYAVVRIDREKDRVTCLQLWSNARMTSVGTVWEEPLSEFEKSLACGGIKRVT